VRWSQLVLLIAWGVVAAPASATPLLELAGSVGDRGGQQGRVAANGASAAYFNPALLVDAPMGLTLGFVVVGSRYGIRLKERADPRADVPNDLANGSHSDADSSRWDGYPLGTDILQNGREASPSQSATTARPRGAKNGGDGAQTYEAIGIVAKFFDQRLSIGFYGLIPNSNFLRLSTFYVDEREQYLSNSLHPEMYSDRLAPLAMAVGGGFRVSDTFSLGLGSTFVISAVADTPVYVADAAQLTNLVLNVDAKAKIGFALHGGFAWNPLPRWRLTGTLHAPQEQEVVAKIKFLLGSGLEQTSSIRMLFDWMPWQVSLGTSFDLVKDEERTVTLVGSAVYGRWSQYVDRHGNRPLPGLAWQDTLTGTLGLRSQLGKLGANLDLQYKPTPIPPQFGRTNYVDNDRLGANAGADYAFTLYDTTLRLGLSAQLFWLLQRSVKKLTPPTHADGLNRTPSLVWDEVPDDGQVGGEPIPGARGVQTNNPGWPGFSSGGFMASAGLYLSVTL
jgi:long-chain fatty acid transport protein